MSLDYANDPRRGCAPGKTDPEIFFADRGGQMDQARAICHDCPFTRQCLDRALDSEERFGIWAGILMSSAAERRNAIARRNEHRVTTGWQRGLADGAIALQHGLHPGAVQKIRAELGLPAHYGPGGRPANREQVAA